MILKIFAPAKINLFLEVESKRKDGYHNITSLIQSVNLYDEIVLKESKKIKFHCSLSSLDNNENLCYKAAVLLQDFLKINKGTEIFLNKKIPSAAGLGGGSSDAAYTIFGLLKLWNKKLTLNKLIYIGENLGSDVPFFFAKKTCIIKGKGEIVNPIKFYHNYFLIIVKPKISISTKMMYDSIKIPHKKVSIDKILHQKNWYKYIYNRLEEYVLERFHVIGKLKMKLLEYGVLNAQLTGSGSSLYGIVKNKIQAHDIGERLKNDNLIEKIFICRPVDSGRIEFLNSGVV